MTEPKFQVGSVYQSRTHGLVEFKGVDNYCGDLSLHFHSVTYGIECYWSAGALHLHFDESKGALPAGTPPDAGTVFVVGEFLNKVSSGVVWDLVGVFTDKTKALGACKGRRNRFFAPLELDAVAPDEKVNLPGTVYPFAGDDETWIK